VEKYLLIPLDDTVVFPDMTVTLPLETDGESHVLLVPRHESEYAKVGTVAEVVETAPLGELELKGFGRPVTAHEVRRLL